MAIPSQCLDQAWASANGAVVQSDNPPQHSPGFSSEFACARTLYLLGLGCAEFRLRLQGYRSLERRRPARFVAYIPADSTARAILLASDARRSQYLEAPRDAMRRGVQERA